MAPRTAPIPVAWRPAHWRVRKWPRLVRWCSDSLFSRTVIERDRWAIRPEHPCGVELAGSLSGWSFGRRNALVSRRPDVPGHSAVLANNVGKSVTWPYGFLDSFTIVHFCRHRRRDLAFLARAVKETNRLTNCSNERPELVTRIPAFAGRGGRALGGHYSRTPG